MFLYHIVWNQEHRKWILKTDDDDIWIRSSYYKLLAIRKAVKYLKTSFYSSTRLAIHLKDGHTEEVREYHKSKKSRD